LERPPYQTVQRPNYQPRLVVLRLRQEPGAPFSLIDPILDQAGRSDVVVLITNLVRSAQKFYQLLVILR